jgi:hypothetical protein
MHLASVRPTRLVEYSERKGMAIDMHMAGNGIRLFTLGLACAGFLSACLSGGGGGSSSSSARNQVQVQVSNSQTDQALPVANVQAPRISGNPAGSITVGEDYSFRPNASDADNDNLRFSVRNLPQWASFNSANGRISGQPDVGDTGLYNGIVVSVSDGSNTVSLPSFSIRVEQTGLFAVTLSWNPPSLDADGSALQDLAGYKIFYGTQPGDYSNSVTVSNAGITRYMIENLSPGTYYFAIAALDDNSNQSSLSNEATARVG